MRRIVLSAFMLALFLTLLSTRTEAQEFVPYIPDSGQVGLVYWEQAHVSYMNITVEFPDTGFSISSWGTPHITSNNISVDAEIWRWTSISFPVITTVSYTYTLGDLLSGEYYFSFEVWGSSIRNTTFFVSPEITVPDNYLTIQEAINAASERDTIFVRNGTYYENVVVNKTVSLIGENRNNTIIDGSNTTTPVTITESGSGTTLCGFTLQNSSMLNPWFNPGTQGLYMESSNCNISHNIFSNNARGIRIYKSMNNTFY